MKHKQYNIRIVLTLVMLYIASNCYGYATIKLLLDERCVNCYYELVNFENLWGLGPGAINIVAVENDSVEYCLYESIGCSIYETVTTAYGTWDICVYSDIFCQWHTDVCREDRKHPLCPDEAHIKFQLKYDNDGNLSGKIYPINYSNQMVVYTDDDQVIPPPDMTEVLEHPEKYHYHFLYLIWAYLAKGIPPGEIYDFMIAYDCELSDRGWESRYNRNDSYYQVFSIYKYLLKHFDENLGLKELKELGEVTRQVREFYGNHPMSSEK